MVELVTGITVKAISGLMVKAAEGSFKTAYKTALTKGKGRALYRSICDPDNNKNYTENVINKTFTFRTIINGDRDVFLDQIYHPLKIKDNLGNIEKVDENYELPNHSNICIVGLAGQGKTITMKKLFLEELNKKNYFPFFISLRSIDFSERKTAADVLLSHFSDNGVETDLDSVKALLSGMKTRIYFDGFDEISDSGRQNALDMFNECTARWKINIVCSSRPDTQICKQSGFLIHNVQFLEREDVVCILDINVNNEETKKTLLALLSQKDFLSSSIKTPILVDIFIVTSVGLGKNPESVVTYYESLFSSLVYKHDYNKIFTRERKSTLTDTQMEKCLSYFAFDMHLQQKTNFNYSDLVSAFSEAKMMVGKKDDDEKNIINDVIGITNLITRDGYDSYTFIHKSIQDFYAAKFISASSEENQEDYWEQAKTIMMDINFCYMAMCLSPDAYYNKFIKFKFSKLPFDENNVKFPTWEDAIFVLNAYSLNFEFEIIDGRKKYRMTSLRSYKHDIAEYPYEKLATISQYMFLDEGYNHIITTLFTFWNSIRTHEDTHRKLEEIIKVEINDNGNGKVRLYVPFVDFLPEFPELDDVIIKTNEQVTKMVAAIFKRYDEVLCELEVKNSATKFKIKNIMSQKARRSIPQDDDI